MSGDSIRIPREWWPKLAGARVLQHRGLERLRAVRRAAAASGAQRDHRLHDADLGDAHRHARAARAAQQAARSSGSCSACSAWPCCWATTFATSGPRRSARSSFCAPPSCGRCGTVLLRKWKPPIAQNTLSGWMMLAGMAAARHRRAVLRDASVDVPRPPVGRRVVRDPLQRLPRRHARALGVVHARANACPSPSRRCRRCPCRWSACSRA